MDQECMDMDRGCIMGHSCQDSIILLAEAVPVLIPTPLLHPYFTRYSDNTSGHRPRARRPVALSTSLELSHARPSAILPTEATCTYMTLGLPVQVLVLVLVTVCTPDIQPAKEDSFI